MSLKQSHKFKRCAQAIINSLNNILFISNPLFKHKWVSFMTFFLAALVIRLTLFGTVWDNLKHGSSGSYGSGAVGLVKEGRFTTTQEEKDQIYDSKNMNEMNFLDLYDQLTPRTLQTNFLPGPAYLLFILWKIFHIYNFTVLIILQAILESVMIGLMFNILSKFNKPVAFIVSCILVLNFFIIRLTLSAGYDFWPIFAVMVYFAGLLYVINTSKLKKIKIFLLAASILGGFTIWCREITTPLSALMCVTVPFILYRKFRTDIKAVVSASLYFVLPTLIILVSLSIYRYQLVDNMRPTRSIFWHTMWSGILCYKNPYIEKPNPLNDRHIWEFGKKLNPVLNNYQLDDMYDLPDSPYEQTLKKEYFIFIKEHPFLFVRNFIYRTATILSPPFYTGGEHITRTKYLLLMAAGFFFLILWFFGIISIYRENRDLFYIIILFFLAFIIPFGLTALMGRVMLVHLFINVIVYLFGIKWILYRIAPGLVAGFQGG
jgi:hypothetical protein